MGHPRITFDRPKELDQVDDRVWASPVPQNAPGMVDHVKTRVANMHIHLYGNHSCPPKSNVGGNQRRQTNVRLRKRKEDSLFMA